MFRKKEVVKEDLVSEDEQVAALQLSTEQIEAEKERKKLEREERKFFKEHQKKSQKIQRLVAPVLLILTFIISFLIWKMPH